MVRRLHSLEKIEKWLVDRDDECKLLPNVRAISAAYQAGELEWVPGLGTYWYNGLRLTQPRPYTPEELLRIAGEIGAGATGFWVERVCKLFQETKFWIDTPY